MESTCSEDVSSAYNIETCVTNASLIFAGILPMWEDPANCNGGKFVVRFKKKRLADRYWEDMMLAIIGEQFEHSEDICGVVISSEVVKDEVALLIANSNKSMSGSVVGAKS